MANDAPVYTKEALTARLQEIAEAGWTPNIRHGNHGGIGNTLEQLLGIKENNLPIPNAAEWELKAQRLYVQAEAKTEGGQEYYWYRRAMRLERFSFSAFLDALEEGTILVDFDARSGHNHGTKFRMRPDCLPKLYDVATVVVPHDTAQLRKAA